MVHTNSNDSAARLLLEAIQQLGWASNSASIVDRVKRLSLGIPAEDEFAFLLSWLGNCSIVHRLDQSQYPPLSRKKFQVPDLLACFETKAGPKPVLVEVKVSNKNKLSWKEEYLNRINKYSSLMGLPILIAWKFHSLWILVDHNCFNKARTDYHLTLDTALKNNLMSFLAGDFQYVMKPNIGLNFHFKKLKLISRKEHVPGTWREKWKLRIDKVIFSDASGNDVPNLPNGLWPLFLAADPISEYQVDDDYTYQRIIIPEDSGMHFAHMALSILIQCQKLLKDKETYINWRQHLDTHKFPVDFNVFKEAASEGIKMGFVQYVLYQQPVTVPDFLEDILKIEQS